MQHISILILSCPAESEYVLQAFLGFFFPLWLFLRNSSLLHMTKVVLSGARLTFILKLFQGKKYGSLGEENTD